MVSKITVPVIFTQKVIKVTRDCPILQHSFWNKKMGTYTGDKGFALLTLLLTSHTQFKTRFNSLAIDILKCLCHWKIHHLYIRSLLIDMSIINSIFTRGHSLKHFQIEHCSESHFARYTCTVYIAHIHVHAISAGTMLKISVQIEIVLRKRPF